MPLPAPSPRHDTRLPPRRRGRRVAAIVSAALLFGAVAPPAAVAQSPNALPALGDSASEDLSVGTEREIGIQIMRIVRRDPAYLDDPMLLEYVNEIWQPLVAAARKNGNITDEIDLRYTFEAFLVRERSVNAFALPGGFVGVHLGLIAMTVDRDELAAVLAHELSHVTQRHIARSIGVSKQASLLGIVATILGVLASSRMGGASGGNAAAAAVTGGRAATIQAQLNFSRDMEREADRVGYGVLTEAGFTPAGMAAMFDKLENASRLMDDGNYPYLRSHPLTVERIGEARARLGGASVPVYTGDILEHAIAQARSRVLMDPRVESLRRMQDLDADAVRAPEVPAVAAPRNPDAKVEQLPDVAVFGIGSRTQRLGAAYASALASTLLKDWQRADHALGIAFKVASEDGKPDPRAERAVRLLAVQSLTDRGDLDRALAMLAPLRAEMSRPVLLLQAQLARSLGARDPKTAQAELRDSEDRLQTWVANHPLDASAWKALSDLWAVDGQPLRALRAEAENEYALGNLPGAIERLRAGQRMARTASASDYIEASVIDSRLRAISAEMRAIIEAQQKGRGPGG
ncbi:MAG TPA: M48 family metalloprotease [Burkholderiaceae bacterium]|nr:M48 family metalloprotease [Burkholderiaceae bacterium]